MGDRVEPGEKIGAFRRGNDRVAVALQGSPQQPGATPQGATADHGLQGHMMTTGDARVQLQQRIGTGPPPGVIRFDRAVIVDASGFEQPLAASTLFIPHG